MAHANWGQKNCMLDQQTGRFAWTAKCTATLAALGAVTGVVSGLLGVGGGFLIVPAFKQLTDVQMRGIVATSLMVISLISLIGVIGAFHAGVHIERMGCGVYRRQHRRHADRPAPALGAGARLAGGVCQPVCTGGHLHAGQGRLCRTGSSEG